MAGGGSQPIHGLKKFKQTGKSPKFTKPFFCLSIPTALLRINWDRQKVPKLQLFLLFPLH
jgi:hypothetical protein